MNSISEILTLINNVKKAYISKALKENESFALKTILQAAFDDRIKFLLPEGEAPFNASQGIGMEGAFFNQCKKLAYFVEGPYPNMTPSKRQNLYIQFLESINPQDAGLVNKVKDKIWPYSNITKDKAQQAFPELFEEKKIV